MNKLYFSYNSNDVCISLIKYQLDLLKIKYNHISSNGMVIIDDGISQHKRNQLSHNLKPFAIQLELAFIDELLHKIKNCVQEELDNTRQNKIKISHILSEKLGLSYPYISSYFSSKCYITIERFLILSKVEKVKSLLKKQTVSEVAHTLNYSSASHLSSQFKNVTGLTITKFLKITDSKSKSNSKNLHNLQTLDSAI